MKGTTIQEGSAHKTFTEMNTITRNEAHLVWKTDRYQQPIEESIAWESTKDDPCHACTIPTQFHCKPHLQPQQTSKTPSYSLLGRNWCQNRRTVLSTAITEETNHRMGRHKPCVTGFRIASNSCLPSIIKINLLLNTRISTRFGESMSHWRLRSRILVAAIRYQKP